MPWYERIKSIKDLTKSELESLNKQMVIVEFNDNDHVLIFLVDDVEHPKCPGYPACCLDYFPNAAEARKAIEETYKNLNYWPKHYKHNLSCTFRSKFYNHDKK